MHPVGALEVEAREPLQPGGALAGPPADGKDLGSAKTNPHQLIPLAVIVKLGALERGRRAVCRGSLRGQLLPEIAIKRLRRVSGFCVVLGA